MTGTTRTVLVAALLALAVFTGVALASPATSTTADVQANETTTTTTNGTTTTTANETTTTTTNGTTTTANETTTTTTNETTTNETTTNETNATQTASVSAPDQQFDGESLTVESATLPDGGFVVVSNKSGAVLGQTEYLDEGNYTDLTVSLNATVEEAQVLVLGVYRNNGSQTYNSSADTVSYMTADGNEVSDLSYVYFQKRGADTTTEDERSTATQTDEPTETDESTETDDPTETTTESSGDTPGFTPITAVVALVAAALVGWRRS